MTVRTLVTGPTIEPVSPDEIKSHLNISTDADDELLRSYIKTARKHAENLTNRALITQTWDLFLDYFPSVIYVPFPPLQSVSSISYLDTNGDSQTLSASVYTVDTDSEPGRVYLSYQQNWPSLRGDRNGVTVRFVAGHTSAANVPEPIKHAIKMIVGHMYENRENTSSMNLSVIPTNARSFLVNEKVF